MPAIPLIASTRNAGKIREIREVLGNRFQVHDLTSLPHLPEVEETGATFHENAALKALAASALSDSWVIADDSGLEVDFLGGAPGVHSARFAGAGADDSKNIALLLEKLRGVPSRLRSARFRCVIALAHHGKIVESFSGAVEGRIAGSALGAGGFGYDPVFIPDGWSKTFAEVIASEKHAISHRARALTALAHWPHWTAP
jgi:XTP/dITP diphosphohydrolase